MVKRTPHIGPFLHSEMGISLGGISPMCACSSIHLQRSFLKVYSPSYAPSGRGKAHVRHKKLDGLRGVLLGDTHVYQWNILYSRSAEGSYGV